MKYWTYIILTEKNTLYTGICTDLKKRFEEHKSGKGAKYTRAFKPIKFVYARDFETKSLAMKEEYRIKQLSRNEKLKLCSNFNLSTALN